MQVPISRGKIPQPLLRFSIPLCGRFLPLSFEGSSTVTSNLPCSTGHVTNAIPSNALNTVLIYRVQQYPQIAKYHSINYCRILSCFLLERCRVDVLEEGDFSGGNDGLYLYKVMGCSDRKERAGFL